MGRFRLHAMRRVDGHWVRALSTDWMTIQNVTELEQWYRDNVQWRGFDLMHLEYEDGRVVPLHSLETFFRALKS